LRQKENGNAVLPDLFRSGGILRESPGQFGFKSASVSKTALVRGSLKQTENRLKDRRKLQSAALDLDEI